MDLPTPDVEGYKGGNTSACYQQLLQVIAASSGGGGDNKQAPRAFAFEIASKVGAEFCQHNSTDGVLHCFPGLFSPHVWDECSRDATVKRRNILNN